MGSLKVGKQERPSIRHLRYKTPLMLIHPYRLPRKTVLGACYIGYLVQGVVG